ncbi:PREDICTED: leucine-rich repeat and calponin homology domain-containing protein 3 isoform X2 [Nicrophorus vespilloides]|uniref:Leucine-rich repeat and calponin homology domain-containing protein 3 isoform X2 n=1 Tax=Nicrophorus vespilloides TaxID=110193 RepID=A0ABM1MTK8_NICVS|nr:PREDICTED: leucine-rich repeat and calponin homology domain-containing protein 3 isoform X2 [Nicrophorus vespilloides]
MAVLASNLSGHIQNQLTKSLERILEDANQSGELKLSNRKLKDFPKVKYNLSDTVIADLSKNRFSELPEEVTTFFFLERLHCYHNAIRYIPESVGSLQSLSYLDLSRNQLTSLPREICQLPIQILLVSNNRLTSLPDEMCRMNQLTELDASCNQLTHLPPRMGELSQLQSLILRANLLLCVPVELTFLQLVRLDLRANRIGNLPVEMRDMHSLIELLVEDNPLTSPPASLCKRGRVHIFKYLENEAIKLGHKIGLNGTGTLGRRPTRRSVGNYSSPVPPSHIPERLKKRQNVDSGYSTSSDDKRWSQELPGDLDKWSSTPIANRSVDTNAAHSANSTPSTISPGPDTSLDDELSKSSFSTDVCDKKDTNNARLSPCIDNSVTNGNAEDKRPLQQIQTYREYKEALKQQRAQDIGSIYRTKENDEHAYKTEPNTPTHQPTPTRTTMATSKSDPTPLNAALGSPKHIFDDTSPKKPVQKVTPSRMCGGFSPNHTPLNGNGMDNGKKYIQDYVKPSSPVKVVSGIMSHDNVPVSNGVITNGKPSSPKINGATKSNGVKTAGRSISWNKDMPPEKMTFTMRREIDKAREETDLINQLRHIIETRLKMTLPNDLAPTLTDGVVLCHLANHIRPRSVASIHVPSPAVPKLTMARCRRNVDNFLEACRKIGVDENLVCCSSDVLEGRGLVQVAVTVVELLKFHSPRSPLHSASSIV